MGYCRPRCTLSSTACELICCCDRLYMITKLIKRLVQSTCPKKGNFIKYMLNGDATRDGASTPSGCYSPKGCGHLQAVFLQRSIVADLVGYPPCLESSLSHYRWCR